MQDLRPQGSLAEQVRSPLQLLSMRVQWLNRLDNHRQTLAVSKGLADSAVLQLRQEERY